MSDIISQLQRVGFGEYEARAYLALLQRNPLNGYELAKASGLPRANIYAVLQKLEERGAVVRLETPDGARYAPVPPQEVLERLGTRFQNAVDEAGRSLENVTRPLEPEYVWNARGYPALLEHGQAMVGAAREQLMLAVWPPEAKALAEGLAGAEKRGVAITSLCLAGCREECGACKGHIHRYQVPPASRTRWLVLVADSTELLAGEIAPDDVAMAVRTRQRLLVELAMWYMRHSIALAALLGDLGTRLDPLLRPETQALLASIGPGGPNGGWLEHMRGLLALQGDRTVE